MLGSWRGPKYSRGSSHGRANSSPLRTEESPSPPPPPPTGPLIRRVEKEDLQSSPVTEEDAKISNCRPVASYTWTSERSATILVPGRPPRWSPQEPRELRPDNGVYYRDHNAARYPYHPMEPAVEAVMDMGPAANEDALPIDLVCCTSTLGNLFRFARDKGSLPLDELRSFRVLVEIIGGVVHFVRREIPPQATIPGVYGYGHSFVDENTSWDNDVPRSTVHSRIVHYCMGGFGCLVRFVVDGTIQGSAAGKATPEPDCDTDGESELLLQALSSHELKINELPSIEDGLKIYHAGVLPPQASVIDIKTRSVRKKAELGEIIESQMPRLWLGQIPNLVLGFHERGTFSDVETHDVMKKMTSWEEANAPAIKRFCRLLHLISDVARNHPDGQVELCYSAERDTLDITEQCQDAPTALSVDAKERWSTWLGREDTQWFEKKGHSIGTKFIGVDDSATEDEELDNGVSDAGPQASKSVEQALDFTACDEECGYCGTCEH